MTPEQARTLIRAINELNEAAYQAGQMVGDNPHTEITITPM